MCLERIYMTNVFRKDLDEKLFRKDLDEKCVQKGFLRQVCSETILMTSSSERI